MSTQALWLEFPTAHRFIKRAEDVPDTRQHMFVEPYRATAAGPKGWEQGYGYRDSANVGNTLQNNPGIKNDLQPQLKAEGTQAAGQTWLPRAGAAAGMLAGGWALPTLASKAMSLHPATRALAPAVQAWGKGNVAKRYLTGQNLVGKVAGPSVLAAGTAASIPGNMAGAALAKRVYEKSPDKFNNQNAYPVSSEVASRYQPHENPLQSLLQSMHNNPEARNAILGLLLGGFGGSIAGGIGGHPIIGALLGAFGGGALGGMNPQFGQQGWNNFYNSAWQQAGNLNNKPMGNAPAKTT